MTNLDNIKTIFFIGIGGIGMSALARYFNARGVDVMGYDKTETSLTKQLEIEGIKIHYEDDVKHVSNNIELVIYTPAIPKNHSQLNYFLQKNFTVKKRSEILEILSENKFTIAVGGSHGKTTVSSMIAHVLIQSNIACTAFLGGLTKNYQSNYLDSKIIFPNSNNDESKLEVFVIEADEYDRSFLRLQPNIAVITAVDTDHLDIYGNKENIEEAFIQFTEKIKTNGVVVANEHVTIIPKIHKPITTYGTINADYNLKNIVSQNGELSFDIICKNGSKNILEIKLPMGGSHNAENAVAASVVAMMLNIEQAKIKNAIGSFEGIKRRFEFIIKSSEIIFIDDYAHHPEEINRFLQSVREQFINKKITAIFQPHLYSRTNDLQSEFASALSLADEVILLDIYPARELPMEGVTSQLIFDKITQNNKVLLMKNELIDFLKNNAKPKIICTIGAGDIDKLVQPIKELYQ